MPPTCRSRLFAAIIIGALKIEIAPIICVAVAVNIRSCSFSNLTDRPLIARSKPA
jgi:hypothetical protein